MCIFVVDCGRRVTVWIARSSTGGSSGTQHGSGQKGRYLEWQRAPPRLRMTDFCVGSVHEVVVWLEVFSPDENERLLILTARRE